MSSLAVSLLLLLVVAMAIVAGYNLRQGAWPRWQRACRRVLPGVRGAARASRTDVAQAREAPARNGRYGMQRGEPRLDARSAREADDLAASGHRASPPESFGSARSEEATAHETRWSEDDAATHERAGYEEAFGDREHERSDARASGVGEAFADAGAEAGDDAIPLWPAAAAAPSASSLSPASSSPGPARSRAAAVPAAPTPHEPDGAATARGVEEDIRHGRSAASTESGLPAATAHAEPVAPASATRAALPSTAPTPSGPILSEACDCIIELVCAGRISGERVLAIAQRFRRAGSKPVAFDARAKVDAGFGPPAAGRGYDVVRVGVLMANRNGPLNAMEFSEFVSAVQAIAETLSARIDTPAMGSVLARARDLDSTCAQLDVQIGVNVEAPEPIEPAQLAALAPVLALVERGSHRYVRPGPSGEPLYSLGFADSPSRLTFLLDVPRVAASLEPFARMVQAADACAQRLGARLVDDGGKPLTQAALAQIARQLGQRYESLEAIGLPAGSTLACKVFN